MIYSLNGTIIHKAPNTVVIECGGVGYKCLTTMNTQRTLSNIGEKTMLYTHMLVRDDAIELCGFATTDELNCFKMLMSISGVGARLAIALLSELQPEQIALAVSTGDSKTLTKANGVGNKLAQRIILELKDKIQKLTTADITNTTSVNVNPSETGNVQQALNALAVLGYSPDEALPYMSGIDSSLPVEKIISETLKAIGKR
ncbi:MAG: Holliday junction branch migration protein RuvA [Clostridia bacterium]|nr:Holliday junction branch migration protein RuvA [Clostridia bacterium]